MNQPSPPKPPQPDPPKLNIDPGTLVLIISAIILLPLLLTGFLAQ